jgi:hypothetical protein
MRRRSGNIKALSASFLMMMLLLLLAKMMLLPARRLSGPCSQFQPALASSRP